MGPFQILAVHSAGVVVIIFRLLQIAGYWNLFYRTGKDSSAFIMSMSILPIKIGIAFGGGVIGYGLAVIGYNPNAEMTPEMVSGIMKLVSLVPAAFCIIPLFIIIFYKLTDAKVAEFMGINTSKRAEPRRRPKNRDLFHLSAD